MGNVDKYGYSIIIPHYNIPQLLRRCLDSIPRRDDLQVIVVDDKSSEESIAGLKILEQDFPHVEFIFSEVNGGGGKARNIGLSHALGRYVLFADADDYFNYLINSVLDEYADKDYDIVFFNASFVDTDTYLPTRRSTTLKRVVAQYEKKKDINLFRYLFGEPWCKLVKREVIVKNHITFDELPVHNDTKYSYLVGYYAKSVLFDNRALYCLADRSGSVSKNPSDEKQYIRTRVFAKKNSFLRSHGVETFDELQLTPIKYYLRKHEFSKLRRCLAISGDYGFTKMEILLRCSAWILRGFFAKRI